MTITVETGAGLADAETYISVSDANTYHAARGATAWAALSESDKEAALRRATDYIVKRTALKFVLQHGPQTIGVVWNKDALRPRIGETGMKILKGLSTAYWFAAIAGALVGIILLFREVGPLKTFTNPILVIWVYFALLHAIYVIQDRYIIPATPFVACLAGVSIGVFLDFYRERRSFNRTKAIAA